MDPANEASRLSLRWYAADAATDRRVLALAHLGAAVLLLAETDPETAEALVAVVARAGLDA